MLLMLLMRKKHTTGCHQRKDGKPYCDAEECQPQVMCREGRGLDPTRSVGVCHNSIQEKRIYPGR